MKAASVLEVRSVTVHYPVGDQQSTPLRSLDLTLRGGSAALMGPSGSGKSTLLRVVAGLQVPDEGHVAIDGVEVARDHRNPELDPRVSLVHQDHRLVTFLGIAENLELACSLRELPPPGSDRIGDALATVGLDGFQARMPHTLSGGEQQRVAIARSLLLGSRLLLADEPTGALDRDNSVRVATLLADIAERGEAMVLVATHDPGVAERLDAVIHLDAVNVPA